MSDAVVVGCNGTGPGRQVQEKEGDLVFGRDTVSDAVMLAANRISPACVSATITRRSEFLVGTWAPRCLALENGELMTEGENLRRELQPRPNGRPEGAEQGDE